MPPQYYLLQTLAPIITGDVSTPEQKEAVRKLAESGFGSMVINPRPLPNKHEEGWTIMTYEGDETRGGAPGTRHRSLLNPKKGLVSAFLPRFDRSITNTKLYADASRAARAEF